MRITFSPGKPGYPFWPGNPRSPLSPFSPSLPLGPTLEIGPSNADWSQSLPGPPSKKKVNN